MVVYGVALLAFCLLCGMVLGNLLGVWIGVQANVGGVGIAMLLLLWLTNLAPSRFQLRPPTELGIHFWSAIYIPIVVAMAAKQNVSAAVSSGWLAIAAGVAAVIVSFALVPVLARIGGDSVPESKPGGNNDR
jgi:malonate transporter MadL subunit